MNRSLAAPESSFRADATTISVVGLAHATSHFFQLLLPPLFPWLATEFSLSFAQLGDEIAKEWRSVTLGEDGISSIPNRIDIKDGIPSPRGFEFWFKPTPRYLIVLAVTLLVVVLHANLIKSRTGRSFQAVRESADTASALGIRVSSVKILAFALSGAVGALAGVFFAYHRGFINPSIIAASPLVLFTGLLLGGSGTLLGPFVGVVLYAVLEKALTEQSIIERHPLYY